MATWPPCSGGMARLVRERDWAGTPLGPARGWPERLRAAVEQVLESPLVATLACGPERVLIYNDAAAGLYGDRHPGALGRPLPETWPEAYASVAHLYEQAFEGRAVQVPAQPLDVSQAGGEVWDVTLTPVRDGEGAVLAVRMTGFEVGAKARAEAALHATEERQAFLLKLSDALRPLADPMDIMAAASEALGRHLGVGRCGYCEVDEACEYFIVDRDWTDGVMPSLKGKHLFVGFGPEFVAAYRAGRSVMVEDALADARAAGAEAAFEAAGGVRAGIGVPLIKGERFVAAIYVQQLEPRHWTAEDETLVKDVAERTWAAVERARAEAALRESEAKHRTLFETMGQGYGEVEIVRDEGGRAVDHRYIELNPAYERLVGVPAAKAKGRLASQVIPGLEPRLHETFGRIARGGALESFEVAVGPLDRWFSVFAYPQGGDRLVLLYEDITDRKRAEAAQRARDERQAFLLQLSDAIRAAPDAEALGLLATRMLAEHLQVDRCWIARLSRDQGRARLGPEHHGEGLAPISGEHAMADFPASMQRAETGSLVFRDVANDPHLTELDKASLKAMGFGAYLASVLRKGESNYVWALAVASTAPRNWTTAELALVEDAAERTWAAVERARAEAALRASEEKYRSLFEHMDQGFCVLERLDAGPGAPVDFRYLLANPAFERHTGLGDPVGRTIRQLVPEPDLFVMATYDRVARTGQAERFEAFVAPLDLWMDAEVVPAEAPGQVAVLFSNVSERKRAEAALRDSEERFRTLADATPALVWSGDGPGADFYNQRWHEFTGLDEAASLRPDAWHSVVHPDDLALAMERSARSGRTGEPYEVEYRLRRHDGAWRWHIARAFRVPGTMRWVGAATDIHDARTAMDALRESQERQAFLLRLADALRPLADPAAIQGEACRVLGEHLHVGWAQYTEVDLGRGTMTNARDFFRGEGPSHVGTYPLDAFPVHAEAWRSGRTLAVGDVADDPRLGEGERAAMTAASVRAALSTSLVKDGMLVAVMSALDGVPREWRPEEVGLLEETAERTWAAIERARAEAALRESEEQLQAFGEASSDVLWIRDADTLQWAYLSPAFERIYGLSFDEALRGDSFRNWLDLVVPEDREHARAMIGRVRGGERVTFEYRVTRPADKGVRTLRNTDFPIRDASGRVARIGGVGHDATGEQDAQKAIERGERRLRGLMEGIPQLVWTAVDGGRWTWSSPQWSEFTGLSAEQSLGLGWLGALHPDDRAPAVAAWEGATERGGLDMEYRLRHAAAGGAEGSADGSDACRWFQTRATPVRDEAGRIVEWLGTSTDVQDLKELTERQAVLVAELQHRTRNLLGVVRSVTDKTLAGSRSLPDFQARIRDRLGALARANGLLSRLHEGERVTFDELLLAELRGHGVIDGDGRGRQVRLSGPKGVRLRSSTVQTFALGLHELATNALKYGALSRPEGRLTVAWAVEEGAGGERRLQVDWREEGVAVPAAALEGGPADALPVAPDGSPGPEVAPPRRRGYGRELIERALPYQLKAETTYEITRAGVRCTITLPISSVSDRDALPDEDVHA